MDGNVSIVTTLCLTGLAFALGIMKDIIVAFLKGERVTPSPTTESAETVRRTCLDHAAKMALLEQRMNQYDIELRSSKNDFKELKESISTIKENLAVLVERSNSRRHNDD